MSGLRCPWKLLCWHQHPTVKTSHRAHVRRPGGFNDPDILQVGKGKSTLNQHRTNYILWAIAKAPLLLSAPLPQFARDFPSLLQLLLNEEVVAINQDAHGVQARKLMVDGERQYQDLGVTPCGARSGIRKGGEGAVRLPKILVLLILARPCCETGLVLGALHRGLSRASGGNVVTHVMEGLAFIRY